MLHNPPGEITALLSDVRKGRRDALDRLLDAVYPAIRTIATHLLRFEPQDITLQSTDLAHEALLRLFLEQDVEMRDRSHLIALAGRQMRRILVEQARARLAQRRGAGAPHAELPAEIDDPGQDMTSLVELDDLLEQLAGADARAAEVVELRFFAGLSREEVAARLGVTVRTVQRDWEFARAWLLGELSRGGE